MYPGPGKAGARADEKVHWNSEVTKEEQETVPTCPQIGLATQEELRASRTLVCVSIGTKTHRQTTLHLSKINECSLYIT